MNLCFLERVNNLGLGSAWVELVWVCWFKMKRFSSWRRLGGLDFFLPQNGFGWLGIRPAEAHIFSPGRQAPTPLCSLCFIRAAKVQAGYMCLDV